MHEGSHTGVQVDVVGAADEFARMRGDWTALLADSDANSLFVTWEWLYTWWRHFDAQPPTIVTVWQTGCLIAIAPFVRRPRSVARLQLASSLSMLGRGEVGSDYLDIIARRGFETVAAAAIVDWLAARGQVLELPRACRRSVAENVATSLEQRGWAMVATDRDVAPYISMAGATASGDFDTAFGQPRYDVRRLLRRLQHRFVVRFASVSNDVERRQALEVLIQLHNRRWSERGGSTAFHTPRLREFHQEISAIALARGWLRLFVLWLDDIPAAVLYGFAYGRKFYFYQSGFNAAYSRLSVGMVAIGLSVTAAREEQLDEYDFLHGAEPYKFRWTRQTRAITTMTVYPPRLMALVHRAGFQARRQTARLLRRLQHRRTPRAPVADIPHERASLVVPSRR